MFLTFYVFLQIYILTSEVLSFKSHHGITLKCSRFRDTGPTYPSLLETVMCKFNKLLNFEKIIKDYTSIKHNIEIYNELHYILTSASYLPGFMGTYNYLIVEVSKQLINVLAVLNRFLMSKSTLLCNFS